MCALGRHKSCQRPPTPPCLLPNPAPPRLPRPAPHTRCCLPALVPWQDGEIFTYPASSAGAAGLQGQSSGSSKADLSSGAAGCSACSKGRGSQGACSQHSGASSRGPHSRAALSGIGADRAGWEASRLALAMLPCRLQRWHSMCWPCARLAAGTACLTVLHWWPAGRPRQLRRVECRSQHAIEHGQRRARQRCRQRSA